MYASWTTRISTATRRGVGTGIRGGWPEGLRSGCRCLVPARGMSPWICRGLRGRVQSRIRVVSAESLKPLPPINEAPLRNIQTLVRNVAHDPVPGVDAPDERVFDVFISHASEDKDEVVRPLAAALQRAGLSVWYDELNFELAIACAANRQRFGKQSLRRGDTFPGLLRSWLA